MLNLKSIYFYFLAKKINLTKKIKKIYFTTNFYNNSLRSKTPSQFYFYPNPFLLSSINSYKKFSYELSNINSKIFWDVTKNSNEEKILNNFLWLSLINRKIDSITIQKIIETWTLRNPKYKFVIWETSTISKRIISWILNADIILNNASSTFKENLFQSIVIQTNHLKKNLRFENNEVKKIETLCALILTGLVFKEYEENYEIANKELKKLTKIFFDEDGFPLNRNPNDLITFLKYYIIIKECIKDGQKYIPEYLEEIIEKNLICLNSIATSKDDLPLFNGSTENNLVYLYKYIEGLGYLSKEKKFRIGGLQILRNKKNTLYFDTGNPPKKNLSSSYQSGPLSFEYYIDRKKIITNCGFGESISKKAMLLSRLTSAQSTLTINDNSVVNFERNKSLNKAFGNSIKSSFKIHDFKIIDNEEITSVFASHNGYEKKFGYIHKRTLEINKLENSISGIDELIKIKGNKKINYNIRFHLYPGIAAVQTMGGENVLIQIEKNKSLIFTSENQKISVEKSIFLARNKILNNLCINIEGNINDENNKIKWSFKKNI